MCDTNRKPLPEFLFVKFQRLSKWPKILNALSVLSASIPSAFFSPISVPFFFSFQFSNGNFHCTRNRRALNFSWQCKSMG